MKIYKINNSIVIGETQTALNNVAVTFYGTFLKLEYASGDQIISSNVLFTDVTDENDVPIGSTRTAIETYLDTEVFSVAAGGGGGDASIAKQNEQIANQDTIINTLELANHLHHYDQSGALTVSQRTVLASLIQHHDNLPLFYSRRSGGAGSQTFQLNQSEMAVVSGTDYAIAQTFQYYEYLSGKPVRAEFTATDFGNQAGVQKSVGQYHDQAHVAPYNTNLDGYRLHSDGTTHRIQIFRAGVTVLDLPQASWDDPLDGTGASGVTIDFDKFNIYIFDFLWLGGSGLRFMINIGGDVSIIHTYNHANNSDNVIFDEPEQPVRFEIRSTGGAGSFQQVCSAVSLETGINGFGSRRGVNRGSSFINANIVGTKYAVIGARVTPTEYQTAANIEKLSTLAGTADGYIVELIHNPIIAGDALVWSSLSNSSIDYCLPNDTNTVTGGTVLFTQYVSSGQSLGENTDSLIRLGVDMDGVPDEQFIVVTPLSTNLDIYGGFVIKEV